MLSMICLSCCDNSLKINEFRLLDTEKSELENSSFFYQSTVMCMKYTSMKDLKLKQLMEKLKKYFNGLLTVCL